MDLLIFLLVFILVLGLIYWLATLVLPDPFPVVVLVIGVIILLFWLLGNVGELDFGNGR